MKKVAIIGGVIVVLVVLGMVIGAKIFTEKEPTGGAAGKQAYYHCYYTAGNNYARCDDNKGSMGCYGYFPLRGGSIKDGIKVDTSSISAATCEGFPPDNAYFTKTGEYVNSSL